MELQDALAMMGMDGNDDKFKVRPNMILSCILCLRYAQAWWKYEQERSVETVCPRAEGKRVCLCFF